MDYKYFDVLLDAIFVVDQQINIVYCNESAAALTGFSVRRLKPGQPLKKFFEFENNYFSDGAQLPRGSEATPYNESKLTTSEGRVVIARVTTQKIENAEHWMLIIRDMTLENALQDKYKNQLQEKEGAIVKLEDAQKQLEQYSKNLEFMVRQRTSALNKTNQTLKAILNSLGQGLMVFNEQGNILPIYSKACEDLFECAPPYIWISDVLHVEKKEMDTFKMWLSHLFSETIPFESVKDLGPKKLPTLTGRQIDLDYYPIRNDDNVISGVVLVGTDKTEEVRAKAEADKERSFVRMVLKITRNRRQFLTFLKDARGLITGLGKGIADLKKQLSESGGDFVLDYSGPLAVFLRALHTLKGGAATFSITNLAEICHEMEDWLVTIKSNGDILMKEEFLQIEIYYQQICDGLDAFLKQNEDIIGAFGSSRSRQLEITIDDMWKMTSELSYIQRPEDRMSYLAREMFCEPIINALAHFDEVVLSTAAVLGKQVSPIVFRNTHIKIFPEKYSGLFATLVHAFRNAVDHGIEAPEERTQKGKSATGLIMVSCEDYKVKDQDWLKIIIEDDGSGIDPKIIRQKMTEKNVSGGNTQSDEEVIQNIFLSQFSTKEIVTEISGRGVGLDAVKYEAEQLGGWVKVSSVMGKGTRLEVAVPNVIDQLMIEHSIKTAA